METSFLIQDLTTIVVTASLVSIVFSLLKWPSILGYLLSGLIVGPYLTSSFGIQDAVSVQSISELGVIFLMFCIGLEFDLKKLKQTLFPSILAMFFQCVMAFFLGAMVAHLLGWEPILGTFLGAIFSISSSMVAIPILKNKNALKQPFAQFTIGVAVLEDIFAVVLLVVLAGARNGHFDFSECFTLIFWITVFISSMLIFGRLAAQKFIRLLKKITNPEIIHICVVGLILLLSELSSSYSNALGAFLAGAIFSSTQVIGKLENMIAPIRDVFTAVFFVSIGMLIDPKIIWEYKFLILLLSLAVVLGQLISAWLGFFLSGQKGNVAFRAALPKAQIGEFSFVIAALAKTSGVDDGHLMAITVGTSLFSIVGVNILCVQEEKLLSFITSKIPQVLKSWGNLYQNILISVQTHLSKSSFINIVKKPSLKIVIHFFLINAIIWCNDWLCDFLELHPLPHTENYGVWIQRGLSILALCIALPFMSCVVRNLNLIILTICKHTLRRLFTKLNHHAGLYQVFQLFVAAIATLVFTWLFLLSSAKYLPTYIPILLLGLISVILGFAFWRRLRNMNSQFEFMFLESFTSELENENEKRRQAMIKVLAQKHPWDVQTRQLTLSKNSRIIGQTLQESQLRSKTNTTLLGVSRSGFFYDTISPSHVFCPDDTLLLLGSEAQLDVAERYLTETQKLDAPIQETDFDFDQIVITDNHPLLTETIASANLRKRFGLNIVGIQRKNERIEKLTPSDMFKVGDCILLVGHRNNIEKFKASLTTAVAKA